QSKLVKYFSRQLSCKRKVALQERNAKLEGFPQLLHWFRIVDIRKEVMEEIAPGQLSLEELLDMTDDQVCATVEKFGANSEECARLNASLSCLRSVHKSGGSLSKQDWTIQWPTTEPGKENSPGCQAGQWGRTHLSQSPKVQPKCGQHHCHAGSPHGPMYTHVDRLTVEGHPGLCPPVESGHRSLPPSPRQRHAAHTPPRTPNIVTTMTPPGTPPVRRRNKLKPPGTPPPSSRKLIHLIPGFTALHRSKSHEFQLGHRVDEAHTPNRAAVTGGGSFAASALVTRVLACNTFGWKGVKTPLCSELLQTLTKRQGKRHPMLLGAGGLPGWTEIGIYGCGLQRCKSRSCPLCVFAWEQGTVWLWGGLSISEIAPPQALKCLALHPAHSQVPQAGDWLPLPPKSPCQEQDALSWLLPYTLKSSPCDGTDWHCSHQLLSSLLPCVCRITSRCPTSQTPAATPPPPHPPHPPHRPHRCHPARRPHPPCTPPRSARASRSSSTCQVCEWGSVHVISLGHRSFPPVLLCSPHFAPPSQNEEGTEEALESEDDFEEMNLSLLSARNFPRKASQTSIFLQEWDIPFEQLEIGELIGKGRFGQVFHGRWHGEVAIRLIDIERDNEDQLKAFKREVMAYRQTRHENVVLFMGACMSPPHLAIITSLCKGRTLYSVVRDAKIVLDVNKTRQIAQEIVKGMGYLHAKGILHKDLKSKNVFYDNGKVVITDFGLFSISGVLQAGRRENKLRIQNGWLCHLAPEIIRQLSPDTEEDKLPFSKHSDVFALGTIWYELHAREWPFKTQPAEAIIWQVGRGMKPNLSQIGMGKEISDILLFCWAYEQEERPTFTKLMDMLEKLPKRNRRLSHPGHFWKSAE
ncbi:KSR2 Kinase, partial [Rhynochetos jubatus]|nr:KSR2 Kinase [Rhynochetos jubatus]